MKKIVNILLLVCTVLCCAFGFAACDSGTPNENGTGNLPSGETPAHTVSVIYNANGGTFADGADTFTQSEVEKGSLLTAPTSPARNNYTFAGWAKDIFGVTMWQFATDTPAGDTTLYAVWKEKSAVLFSVEGASIQDSSVFMFVDHTTDSVSLSSKVVCSADSVWRLYYDKLGQTEIPTKIASGKLGALANGENLFYVVVSSQDGVQVNVYELTVYRSYSVPVTYYDGAELLHSDSTYTGYEYTAEYTPNIKGYTFNGWESSEGEFTSAVVWQPLVLSVNKTANTYQITYDVNGGEELAADGKEVAYDSAFYLAEPKRTGYTFLGWYLNGTQLTDGEGDGLFAWNYDSNKTLTAKWQANTYTVTVKKNLNGATVSSGGTFTYGSEQTISVSNVKLGYEFLGWYEGELLLTSELDYTFVVSNVEKVFVAKFSLDKAKALEAFVYTSTATTCTITGVQDVSVTELTIPDFVTQIASGAFSGCSSLTSITIPFVGGSRKTATDTDQYPFGYIFGTSSYTGGTATKQYYYGSSTSSVTSSTYYIPSSLKSVTVTGGNILYGAFRDCSGLTSIEIPDSVTTIGSSAFWGCSGLTSIEIPNSVTTIGTNAFYDCSGLTSVEIPNSVTSIGNSAFEYCSGLTSIEIPNSVTTIGDSAFEGCSGLTSITVESGNSIYHSSGNCIIATASKTLVLGCKNSIIPSDGSVTAIGNGAFFKCSSLTSIEIPNSVTTIGHYAFESCSGLTSIEIPNSVTTIASGGFCNCSGLTSVVIGDSVTTIGSGAFYKCSSLKKVYYKGTASEWSNISIASYNSELTSATRYYI